MSIRVSSQALITSLVVILVAGTILADNKTITYQGRLTETSGDPVPDGPQTFDFAIYNAEVGGTLRWSETGVVAATADGFFTLQIGSVVELDPNFWNVDEPHYLEITVNSETLTPRTPLTASPYAKAAQDINGYSVSNGVQSIRTYSDGGIINTFGSDGLDQTRLWGSSYGELLLWDGAPANNQNVRLSANGTGGGSLLLVGQTGSNITLSAQVSGDNSAQFSAGSINNTEIQGEAGFSFSNNATTFTHMNPGTSYPIDSATITVPINGYIIVEASGYVNLVHQNGTDTNVRVRISESEFDFNLAPGANVTGIPQDASSGTYQIPFSPCEAHTVAPGTYTFYLVAYYGSGVSTSTNVAWTNMRALFVPTLYGTSTFTQSSSSSSPATIEPGVTQPTVALKTITREQHDVMVQAQLDRQRAEFEARISELETQVNTMVRQTGEQVRQ